MRNTRTRFWTGWATVICLAFGANGTVHGQGSVVTTLGDLKGIFIDIDATPTPGPNDPIVTPGADIAQLRTTLGDATNEYRAAHAEYAVSTLNADGVFAARIVGTIDLKSGVPAGIRDIQPDFYAANGIVEKDDFFATALAKPGRIYPTVSYDSAIENSVAVDVDVTSELRQVIRDGATHFGTRFVGTNGQGASTISAADPIDLEVTEYFANPIDAAPLISGGTGLSFRGQTSEFISQGATRLLTLDDWNFELDRNFDNGISVTLNSRTVAGLRWSVDFAAPNNAMLRVGDTFEATRWPFHDDMTEGGFSLSGEGRGLNNSSSTFTINDVLYDTNGTVLRLDAEFIQRDLDANAGFGSAALVGRIQVNAVPEPSSCGLLAVGAISAFFIRKRKRRDDGTGSSPNVARG